MAKRKKQFDAQIPDELTPDFLRSVGGKRVALGPPGSKAGGEVWDFGWIPPESRTEVQHAANHAALADMPRFAIDGSTRYPSGGEPEKMELYKIWQHPKVVETLTFPWIGTHQFTGSCFPEGTPVRMADGEEKPIELVSLNDEAITHTGNARRVVHTMRRRYTGDMVTLHVVGFAFPLTMTADHKVAVMSSECEWRSKPDKLVWKRAGEIDEDDWVLIGWDRRDAVSQSLDVAELLGEKAMILDDLMNDGDAPVSNVQMAQYVCRKSGIDWRGKVKLVRSRHSNAVNRHIPVCPSLARLIGLYLAEGGCDEGRVIFTFDGRNEEHLAAEVLALVRGLFGVEGEIVRQAGRETVIKVRFTNNTLAAIFKSIMPGDVYTKRVPGLFFRSDEETKLALLLGWLHGDGSTRFVRRGTQKKYAQIQGTTASPELARDMTTLAMSLGMRVSVSRRKPRNQSREAYDVYLTGPKAVSLFPAVVAEMKTEKAKTRVANSSQTRFGYARRVKRVEKETVTDLMVYDFEVEEDHSFIAGGLVVHNCVWAGAQNVICTLHFIDVLQKGEAEELYVPFGLLAYGRSRYYMGDRNPGEGSLGSTYAKAARDDGFLNAKQSGLPEFKSADGIEWGSRAEMSWSDGDASQTMNLLPESRKRLVQTTARCRSADDVREAIVNGYPVTCASMYAHRPRVESDPPVLLGRRSGSWSHQMSILAWWLHPKLGELFWLMNQWGLNAHGKDPAGGPPGGVWILKSDVDWICRDEVFAFSQYNGYPAPVTPIPWIFQRAA